MKIHAFRANKNNPHLDKRYGYIGISDGNLTIKFFPVRGHPKSECNKKRCRAYWEELKRKCQEVEDNQPPPANGREGSPNGWKGIIKMKKGDKVIIYEDPITKTKLEGRAILVKKIFEYSWGERWTVKFENGDVVDRTISPHVNG